VNERGGLTRPHWWCTVWVVGGRMFIDRGAPVSHDRDLGRTPPANKTE